MTSDDHELHTLAGAFVLDAVSDTERASFSAHVAGCAECRADVSELHEAAARLGTAEAVRPRPELRELTIQAAYQTSQLAPVTGKRTNDHGTRRPARPGRLHRLRAVPAVIGTAAALAIAAGIAVGTHYADQQGQRSLRQARMVSEVLNAPDAVMRTAPVSTGGMAIVVTSRHEHMGVFIAHGLPALPRARSYEVWLMGPHGEQSAGLLTVRAKGMAGPVVLGPMSPGDMVGLTVEPAGGSLRPTSAPVVLIGPTSR
ncbi:MAG TPA: anti-sigma factor [Streptosporangiaceae bacterium]|nr:anti-sigma factor [Streptosporangiaceae bacterium]